MLCKKISVRPVACALAGDCLQTTVNVCVEEVKTGVRGLFRHILLSARHGFPGKIARGIVMLQFMFIDLRSKKARCCAVRPTVTMA